MHLWLIKRILQDWLDDFEKGDLDEVKEDFSVRKLAYANAGGVYFDSCGLGSGEGGFHYECFFFFILFLLQSGMIIIF